MPDLASYHHVLPATVRGFDVTFIPLNFFDDFWMMWFFPDSRSALHYYRWAKTHDPSSRQLLHNAVIEHEHLGAPWMRVAQRIILGCLRRGL